MLHSAVPVRARSTVISLASCAGDALFPRRNRRRHCSRSPWRSSSIWTKPDWSEPALLPADVCWAAPSSRARADHRLRGADPPDQHLRALKYLRNDLDVVDESGKDARHCLLDAQRPMKPFERQLALLAKERAAAALPASKYCWGDKPTLADCCLVPQIFNVPALSAISKACC